MVFFSNAQGTNVQIVADPVNQGSTNANEVIFAGPFASSNTVTVTYRTPNGISLAPRILSLVDGAQIIDGVEYNAWTGLLDAAVTEFAGTVTAMFSITASEGTTIVTNPAYFEVHEGVYVAPPADPSADVWGKVLSALTTTNERIDNVILTNVNQSKNIAANKAAIEEIDGQVTAHSAQIKSLQNTKLDKQTGETANHMVYAKTPEGAQEMLPFPSGTLANIQDGEPEGSLEQLSSEAQGEYDAALGNNNVTSAKGYYIQGVYFAGDTTLVVIGTEQKNPIALLTTTPEKDVSFVAPLWKKDDYVSIISEAHLDLVAKVSSVENNIVTINRNLSEFNLTKTIADITPDENSVFAPARPKEGVITLKSRAFSEGSNNVSAGTNSHSEGSENVAAGDNSHAEGRKTIAGYAAHAENIGASATGLGSHSEGFNTLADGNYSHAEGNNTTASGQSSHAEGASNTSSGNLSHTEGGSNVASGVGAHCEGSGNTASHNWAHVQGIGNVSGREGQFVAGTYSKEGLNGIGGNQVDSTLIVRIGAGKDPSNPQTIFSIDDNGTTCMRFGAVKTDGITASYHVISKAYADAHYAPIGGAYTEKEKPYTLTMEKTKMCIWDQAENPVFDASTGLFVAKDYGGNIVERTLEQVVQNGGTVPITFKPLYSTKKREETWGTMTDYYFPIWFSVTTTENADGTVTLNGTMRYVAK